MLLYLNKALSGLLMDCTFTPYYNFIGCNFLQPVSSHIHIKQITTGYLLDPVTCSFVYRSRSLLEPGLDLYTSSRTVRHLLYLKFGNVRTNLHQLINVSALNLTFIVLSFGHMKSKAMTVIKLMRGVLIFLGTVVFQTIIPGS